MPIDSYFNGIGGVARPISNKLTIPTLDPTPTSKAGCRLDDFQNPAGGLRTLRSLANSLRLNHFCQPVFFRLKKSGFFVSVLYP
jgi:hypothetical protein